jgi:hypothetical protein
VNRSCLAAAIVGTAFKLYIIIGMFHYLAWTTARWNAAETLSAQGIALENMAGGVEWVGWHEFEAALPLTRATGKGNSILAWM